MSSWAVRAAASAVGTTSRSLVSTITSLVPGAHDRVEDLRCRGPVGRPAGDDGGTRLTEEAGQPGAEGDHHDRAALPGRSGGTAGDLLGEVGDPHPVGTADGDARLDGGTDVVDVDVDVPQPLPAHDHQGVTQDGERVAKAGDDGVVGVEEVHHLVGGPLGREVVGRHRPLDRPLTVPLLGPQRAPTGQGTLRRFEHDAQTPAASVDDAGLTEHLELLGGVVQRLLRRAARRPDDPGDGGVLPPGCRSGGVRRRPRDREDGALDGVADGGVGGLTSRPACPRRGRRRGARQGRAV